MASRRQPREAAARARHGKVARPQSKTRARPRGSGESTPAPATPDERAAGGRAARSTIAPRPGRVGAARRARRPGRAARRDRERPSSRRDGTLTRTRPDGAITWAGHATVLLSLDGARLLTDPVLRDRVGPLVRIADPPPATVGERLDAVLLSHIHADHADPVTLRRIAARHAGDRAARAALAAGRARESPMCTSWPPARRRLGPLRVRDRRARRAAASSAARPKADAVGFVVEGSRSLYFAGDTDLFDEMTDDLRRAWTWRCCRSGVGDTRSARGTSTPSARPMRRCASLPRGRSRSTGGRSRWPTGG